MLGPDHLQTRGSGSVLFGDEYFYTLIWGCFFLHTKWFLVANMPYAVPGVGYFYKFASPLDKD